MTKDVVVRVEVVTTLVQVEVTGKLRVESRTRRCMVLGLRRVCQTFTPIHLKLFDVCHPVLVAYSSSSTPSHNDNDNHIDSYYDPTTLTNMSTITGSSLSPYASPTPVSSPFHTLLSTPTLYFAQDPAFVPTPLPSTYATRRPARTEMTVEGVRRIVMVKVVVKLSGSYQFCWSS
ncbi:hypothetical protein BDQ17DRAFT_1432896 [Cyathus striatus]|nr:hypothetical protein BDQ17DRAFT_1432896 [Cyathus striatus]